MGIAPSEQTVSPSALALRGADTRRHENLITDALLTRALQAILEAACASGQMRARQMRERANLTLAEAIQVLLYLQRQEVLQEAVDGVRIVNLALVRDYLAILDTTGQALREAPEAKPPFTRPEIAWGCVHAARGKLTQMRLAHALGLAHSGSRGALLFPTSRAKRLIDLVTAMSEQERAFYARWAESQLLADEKAEERTSAL